MHVSLISLLLLFYLADLQSQTEISGVINSYSAVDSIIGNQSVIVRNPSHFQSGDTVLLIQMKGLSVITVDTPTEYGRQQDINKSGNYEFLLVDRIDNDTVRFTRELIKEYDAFETAQLVKVKGYESARITNTLEAMAWDGEKGGVLAIIVTNTLIMEANIDVSARGFKGGDPVPRSDEACAASDPDTYENFSFPAGSDKAGKKGESPATYYLDEDENRFPLGNDFTNGWGRIATGGGGGNGKFAGGGGGSNFDVGGFGGNESAECPDFKVDGLEIGGIRGSSLIDQLFDAEGNFTDRFYLGGGGGGSTEYGERTASSGGSGGGVVIIIANYIDNTGDFGIYADGKSVTQVATAGAGGGGGGGMVVASIDNYIASLDMYARGGKGGDVDHETMAGPGGGGGGGAIIHSGATLPAEVTPYILPGASGTNLQQNDPYGSSIGSPGGVIENLEVTLNGILFNGILTEKHTICEDTSPGIIEGTRPRGGETPYLYEWYRKTDGTEWLKIDGAEDMDYQPEPLVETTSYLRVVKDQDFPQVIDSSNYLTITVQPKIIGNIISEEQTICEGETPVDIEGDPLTEGGTGVFEYQWNKYTEADQQWLEADNENDQLNYTPPALYDSTFYVRIAFSGACIDTSNIVPVNVHPAIINNTLDDDQTICHGDTPAPVSAPQQVTGGLGEGSYVYIWESSTNSEWNTVDDSGNNASYPPGSLTADTRYRRIVESGNCRDISPPQIINVLPLISDNSISEDQTICFQGTPELFTGSEPAGGDGSYTFRWESATENASWATAEGETNNSDYLPPALSDTTYFRRIVYSGSNDACKDTSNTVSVDFHPFSYADLIETTDTICAGEQSELSFTLSGENPWTLVFSDGNEDFTINEIETGSFISPVSPGTSDSATYSYHIVSLTDKFGCTSIDEHLTGSATVRVYAYPEPDAGSGGEVCGPVFDLNATPGFGRGLWEISSATAQFSPDAASPDAAVTVDEYGTHEFVWTETNWQCASGNSISVTFYEQPVDVFAGEDQKLHYIFETHMEAEIPEDMISSANGMWELLEGTGNIVFPEDPGTLVTDLSFGENIFVWTIYNGVCEPASDQITVLIEDLDTPTGFSPNNSGLNDRFIIKGLENSSVNELTIFNRQGNVVYRAVNYKNDWEGRNQNGVPLPEDTYYYILNVDNQHSYKGFIVLKR
ncbi:MAG: gliding motility-associated C-terminal domain-containing protein [Bacteroidales bacterium]